MRIGILGTGMVGQALAGGLSEQHTVRMGTRDPAARQAPAGVALVSADQACDADLVVNALNGQVSLDVLGGLKVPLSDRILIDLSNPLDFSTGAPRLFTDQDTSLGEQIQHALPTTRVVKTWNTLNAGLMLNPAALSAPSALFLSGDDAGAKQVVHDLLVSYGWQQIIDLGGIETARGTELMLPMWLQVMNSLGGPAFNWAIVR